MLPWPEQVLDALEQGVVALDRERKVIYNNRRIEELLGVEPGTLLGQAGAKLFPGADARWGSASRIALPRLPAYTCQSSSILPRRLHHYG